jgi:putative transposase
MNRAHVIRLNPTPEQAVYFRKACGVARHAYNWALARWKEYRAEGKRVKIKDLKAEYNRIKGEQFPWCYEVTKCAPEQDSECNDFLSCRLVVRLHLSRGGA